MDNFNITTTARSMACVALAGLFAAGCSADGSLSQTGAIATTAVTPAETRIDPACIALTAQIDGLRKDGIAEKIEKAAARKYTMKRSDIAKVDELTKANADFQAKCASFPRPAVQAQAQPSTPTPSTAATTGATATTTASPTTPTSGGTATTAATTPSVPPLAAKPAP